MIKSKSKYGVEFPTNYPKDRKDISIVDRKVPPNFISTNKKVYLALSLLALVMLVLIESDFSFQYISSTYTNDMGTSQSSLPLQLLQLQNNLVSDDLPHLKKGINDSTLNNLHTSNHVNFINTFSMNIDDEDEDYDKDDNVGSKEDKDDDHVAPTAI